MNGSNTGPSEGVREPRRLRTDMTAWKTAWREGAVAGPTLPSTAVLAVLGQRENASAVAPVTAVSHWL